MMYRIRYSHKPRILIHLLFLSVFSVEMKAETIDIATGEYPPWTSAHLPHDGYINHLVTRAFALSGIKVKFHYMPWKRALEATKVGQFHASSFWLEDKSREADFLISDVVNNDPFVFFYRKQGKPLVWNTLGDLTGYRIGATRGYTYSREFWRLTEEHVLRVSVANNDVQSLNKLISGEIDIFPISELTGKYLLKQNFNAEEIAGIAINTKPLKESKSYLLFSKNKDGNIVYLEEFNRNLKKILDENKLEPDKHELLQ